MRTAEDSRGGTISSLIDVASVYVVVVVLLLASVLYNIMDGGAINKQE